MKQPDYLFVGVYPNAYMYCDKTKETNGDYHLIAAVYFRPLILSIEDDSPDYAEAIQLATEAYDKIKANPNEPIEISATGQTILPSLPTDEQ